MKIIIYGGGSFGTAIAHQLAENTNNKISILMRDKALADDINKYRINPKYFKNRKLNEKIYASTDEKNIRKADILIITIPTKNLKDILKPIKENINSQALIVNMAKGISDNRRTIVEYLKDELQHTNIVSLKGASFSTELMDSNPTLLTLGYQKSIQLDILKKITQNTNIFLDYTTDIRGVEVLSALKNIYAILLGNIDGYYNSSNTRFLFLTKAIAELKIIIKYLGAQEETIFLSCGIGDFCLTSLNDLSRNRTLGLLIGKGFYNPGYDQNSVVLEGIKTLTLIDKALSPALKERLPLLKKMISFFIEKNSPSLSFDFEHLLSKKFKTVITYGTFDLLHFGHLEILRRAKDLGDKLIVGLSTDEFNKEKGKICQFPYLKRKEFLESLTYVDLVIPEENWDQKENDLIENEVDVFIMGNDWKGQFDFLNKYCEVLYLPRTKGISTTALKSIIKDHK